MSEKENEEVKEEEVDNNPINSIIDQLKGFQGIIDSDTIKMKIKDIREWAGHMNYSVTFLIEEFQKLRDTINTFLSDQKYDDESIDKKANFYV